MFIWKASTILAEIRQFLPDLHAGLTTIEAAMGKASEAKTLAAVYRRLASVSIDYGVMEKAKDVFMIPADFGWSDVGSWDTLWEISAKDEKETPPPRVFALLKGSNSLVHSPKKLVALVASRTSLSIETKRRAPGLPERKIPGLEKNCRYLEPGKNTVALRAGPEGLQINLFPLHEKRAFLGPPDCAHTLFSSSKGDDEMFGCRSDASRRRPFW
jgi:mannose-1-phosphate guanylyltransferase